VTQYGLIDTLRVSSELLSTTQSRGGLPAFTVAARTSSWRILLVEAAARARSTDRRFWRSERRVDMNDMTSFLTGGGDSFHVEGLSLRSSGRTRRRDDLFPATALLRDRAQS